PRLIVGMEHTPIVIPFDRNDRNPVRLQATENLLCLSQMRRFNGWAVEEVTGNQKKVGSFGNCFVGDEGKRLRQVSVWQLAVEPAAPKVNICSMKQFHGTRPSSVVGTRRSSALACIADVCEASSLCFFPEGKAKDACPDRSRRAPVLHLRPMRTLGPGSMRKEQPECRRPLCRTIPVARRFCPHPVCRRQDRACTFSSNRSALPLEHSDLHAWNPAYLRFLSG